MKLLHPTRQCLAALALALAGTAGAQTAPPPVPATPAPDAPAAGAEIVAPAAPGASSMDAQLFYQVLLGELTARDGEPAAAFSLLLDAARKNNDGLLYQRAITIALQSRSGESALQAAAAWKDAQPESREANRYVLQILVALNRIAETGEPLARELQLTPQPARGQAYSAIAPLYARAGDKKLAAEVVERALARDVAAPGTAAPAWVAVGRMRLAAGDSAGALDAARRSQSADPAGEGPALLGLELMDAKVAQAELLVQGYLAAKPRPEIRLAYARALIEGERMDDAAREVRLVTGTQPDLPDAWLIQGTLELQQGKLDESQASLERYLERARPQETGADEEQSRGLSQAYMLLAQIAERRKDLPGAEAWLQRIQNPQDLIAAQSRRAGLLARQGRLDEARRLLRALPERDAGDARAKLSAEVQLLRDNDQNQAAYDLLDEALRRTPQDADLLYDQAMVAEKLKRDADMERLLRAAIAARPDYYNAYNALGYAFADRGVRLDEARQLIVKALEYAPGDPFISDSLAWVEFRKGNKEEALRILDEAFRKRPDAEIAAHLGEVLWSLGQKGRATAVWKEGLQLNTDNTTLRETLQRLKVQP